jgi:hypothetical protein
MAGKNGKRAEWQATAGREMRQARLEGVVVELPSGYKVRLRPVAIDGLMAGGEIPDLLTPIAARSLWTVTGPEEIAARAELAAGFIGLVRAIVPAALVEPRIAPDDRPDGELGDDEIKLDDLDFSDKLAIFQLATQPAAVLRSFRERQAAGMAAVHDGESVRQPAV